MWLTFITGVLVLLLAWDFVRKRHRVTTFKKFKITGPLSVPILGCGIQALSLGAENIMPYMAGMFNKYGKSFRLWVLDECIYYTMDVKDYENILSSTTLLEKGQIYRFMRPFLNDGILVSKGKKWHARRKVFTNAFHFKVLEHYMEIMDRNSGVLVEKLRKVADGKTPVDILQYVSLATLDVITEAAMGVQVNAQNDPDFPYIKALERVVYIQPGRMLKFSQRYDWLFSLLAPRLHRQLVSDIRVMNDFTDKVIHERRTTVERAKADGSYRPLALGDAETGSKSKLVLLDILLQATINNEPLSDADIREEVDNFMFAGNDTTGSGTSHALYAIARNSRIQQRLFEEIVEVLGQDPSTPVTQSQLSELKYLDCVIKETLRLHTIVPTVGRYTTKDLVLGEKVIPANTSIYLVPYATHRDPEYFPDPLTFKPERFLEGEAESHATFAYAPFSAGPRNCIGQKFGTLEMKCLISKVLRYYELLPLGKELRPMMNFILRSSTGINVGLRPRKL
ncbi:probable cytochrome P450 4d20 [Drosophila kikkawai]|uniref:Probable cytochrome P450 4d20 n=1 Tax=Drosophila kikkawai TaxID=30033 RepID=A0ABM4GG33_DROKI